MDCLGSLAIFFIAVILEIFIQLSPRLFNVRIAGAGRYIPPLFILAGICGAIVTVTKWIWNNL